MRQPGRATRERGTGAADPAVVWAALLNPEVLQRCVPGCESLTGNLADGFAAVGVQKVGPVKARFAGKVTFSDIIEGHSLRIAGEGRAGLRVLPAAGPMSRSRRRTVAAYVKFDPPARRFALTGGFVAQFAEGVRMAVTGASNIGVFRWKDAEAALSANFSAGAIAGLKMSPMAMINDLHGAAEYRPIWSRC